jgi:hypothetical protein
MSDQVIIFGLFQEDCEGRGAIIWEPTSKTEIDAVNALFDLGKYSRGTPHDTVR